MITVDLCLVIVHILCHFLLLFPAGGTSVKRGRDKGFTDASHIAGQAIRMNQCKLEMLCGNQTVSPYAAPPLLSSGNAIGDGGASISGDGSNIMSIVDINTLSALDKAAWQWWLDHQETQCYTPPFVRCGDSPNTHKTM